MKKTLYLCTAGFMVFWFAGCSTPRSTKSRSAANLTMAELPMQPSTPLGSDLLKPSEKLFTLGPGDYVEIEIIGQPKSRATTMVCPDGKIYFNILPGVNVWGLTLAQARELLQKELARYISDPEVSLSLREVGSKDVWMLGSLAKPGIYPISGPMTLLEAVAQAGGISRAASAVSTEDLADLRHSFVIRHGRFLPVDFYRLLKQGDMSQNIYLQPDDFIYVPSALARRIFVLGWVRNPSSVGYNDQVTLVSAITRAGGTLSGAYSTHVAVVRGSLSNPQIAVVDYKAILKGQAPDVVLEPHDIVYVPHSPYDTLNQYLYMIVNTFTLTVAANEGVNAVSTGNRVGVSVPVGGGTQ